MATAFLVDGDFFLRRLKFLAGMQTPCNAAKSLHRMCLRHLKQDKRSRDGTLIRDERELYRIFFYDCPPLQKKVHNPVTNKAIDFAKTPTCTWREDFHKELRKLRKVALRFGYINERTSGWLIKQEKVKELLAKRITLDQLKEEDVYYDIKQKGVDMRIGLDIASISYKKQVNQIVLVAGDSDFVPAAKLARREGIDFILDPMWAKIREDLHEHIDGLKSVFTRRDTNITPPHYKNKSNAHSVSNNARLATGE